MNRAALATALAVLAIACAPIAADAAVSHPITFRTDDGVTIAATLYEGARHPAPAVILLHMLTRSRDDWQTVATRLADAGIQALAIDFRGHGGSAPAPGATGGDADLARLALDVKAARAYLASRPDLAQATLIGIAGASLGANIAVIAAAADPSIRSLALLSPSVEYRGLRADAPMRKYGGRPALMVAGTNDAYAMRSAKELAALGGGAREIKTLEDAGHGTNMLNHDPDLVRVLVDWFLRTLL